MHQLTEDRRQAKWLRVADRRRLISTDIHQVTEWSLKSSINPAEKKDSISFRFFFHFKRQDYLTAL